MGKITVLPGIKALIFDCDGTLADSMPLHMLAWKMALEDFGEAYREDFLDPLKGMNEEEIVKLYNQTFGRQINPKKLVDRKHQFFLEKIHFVQPVKAVIEVVFLYRSILPMAVVSGGRRTSVFRTLESLGIRDCFKTVLTADDPIPPKPAPDLFLEAARHLNTEPRYCQVFEDGDLGIKAALAAGMKATDIRQYVNR